MSELWAGTDAGKAEHHCAAIDTDGKKVLSRRVPNDGTELLELLGDVLDLADGAPRHLGGGPQRGRSRLVDRTPGQPRVEADLHPRPYCAPRLGRPLGQWEDGREGRLRHRRQPPACAATCNHFALGLPTGHQTPAALGSIGKARPATWLENHGVRTANTAKSTAEAAVTAAEARSTVPGKKACAKAFYRRKRDEGKSHKQAILALARCRLNVLWALIRNGRTFDARLPGPAAAAA